MDVGQGKVDRRELIELLEETEAYASPFEESKFNLYKPNDIMLPFHTSPAKRRFLGGGNRSGKSEALVEDSSISFLGQEPESLKGMIPKHRLNTKRKERLCTTDYPNGFEKVIWPKIQEKIPPDKIQAVKKDQGRVKSIINYDGGFLEFMNYEQDVIKFAGSARHAVKYDEAPTNEGIIKQNRMRLIDYGGEEVYALTLEEGAVSYLAQAIYDVRGRHVEKDYKIDFDMQDNVIGWKEGRMRDYTLNEGDSNTHCFFACVFDNQHINLSEILDYLRGFSREEIMIKTKGSVMHLQGLIYKIYNEATHVVDDFDWNTPDYTLYVVMDVHPQKPHYVIFGVVQRDTNRKFIVDELIFDGVSQDFIYAIKEKCQGKIPNYILIDPLANTPDPKTKITFRETLIMQGLNNPCPISASKRKDTGILWTRDALKLQDANDKSSAGLYVCRSCRETRYQFLHWGWGKNGKPSDDRDDQMENTYRFILHRPEFVDELRYDEDEEFPLGMVHRGSLVGGGVNKYTGY